MLLSTFELLLKPITPSPGNVPGSNRGILQGYFLTVSNPNNFTSRIRLRFNATTPSLNPAELLVISDTTGTNAGVPPVVNPFGGLIADGPNRFRYDFVLNANDTGLVILQPNILTLNPDTANVEVRGYVEIFVVSFFPIPIGTNRRQLLVNPEHRGTFLPSPGGSNEFDQLITSLPTSTGAGLLNVDFIIEPLIIQPTPFPIPQPFPLPLPNGEGLNPNQNGNLSEVLNVMAQRLESLENRLASAQS